MASTTTGMSLPDLYSRESAKIRRAFEKHSDGLAAVQRRAALVDQITIRLWEEFVIANSPAPQKFCLVARGGYGRGALFPHSDIDLLFLAEQEDTLREFKVEIGRICQEMWDLRLRVSPTARTLAGCANFDPNNLEMLLSLIDTRYLAGDAELFQRLREEALPQLIRRERQSITLQLAELSGTRHQKYGNTIFHLEPNVKECPGGLRDYDVACWLRLISVLDRQRNWESAPSEEAIRHECHEAVAFLTSVRCFLHYLHGRDDNTLSWEAQDTAAERHIGMASVAVKDAAEWMRTYYRCARQIARWTNHHVQEVPRQRSSLYRQFLQWRSRVGNGDFSVVEGRVYLQQSSSAQNPDLLLGAFAFIARHGLKLARDTERRIEQALPTVASGLSEGVRAWPHLKEILLAPHAALALREMQALGALKLLIPEFEQVDALVVRDFYHRYTVDEHTFTAIDMLHRLKRPQSEWESRIGEILGSLEQPELLFGALLLHDVGKGRPGESHLESGAQIAETVLSRFALAAEQKETVRALIVNHLEMSATLRRDIFAGETIRAFAEKVGSPELLKMLCLLTYADIRGVNPEALTAWKAESLWHLYVGALNYLNHSADETHAREDDFFVRRVAALAPRQEAGLQKFLAGLPRRYLRTHSAEQVAAHFAMASSLKQDAVQLALEFRRDVYEMTLITSDRPFLFATICGALTAWGMDIVKASAFSNAAGVVVDTLVFRDRFRTLELNPEEKRRFEQAVARALAGEVDLESHVQGRIAAARVIPIKQAVETRLSFDQKSSSHSTLLELVTQDRPGLLYRTASTLARLECNIEIALIDTEGPTAIDVFYVTRSGKKLEPQMLEEVRAALMAAMVRAV